PGMVERGWGRVVNIGSDAGRVGSSLESVYSAAKGGVIAFTKTLARELARTGVTANTVCPGPTRTPMLAEMEPRLVEALERAVPMRRRGERDAGGAEGERGQPRAVEAAGAPAGGAVRLADLRAGGRDRGVNARGGRRRRRRRGRGVLAASGCRRGLRRRGRVGLQDRGACGVVEAAGRGEAVGALEGRDRR